MSSLGSWSVVLTVVGTGVCLSAGSPLAARAPALQRAMRVLATACFTPFIALGTIGVALSDLAWRTMSLFLEGESPELTPGTTGPMDVETFDPDTADWKLLRRLVRQGKPFILRCKDGRDLTGGAVKPPDHAFDQAFIPGTIRVVFDSWLKPNPGIDEIKQRIIPGGTRVHWPLWFLGEYDQGFAHIDLTPATINLYFLRQGRKEIVLAPPGVTRKISLDAGYDSLFINKSDGNYNYLPGGTDDRQMQCYYRFVLEPQSLLVFNNSACLHHFRNHPGPNGETPQALSTRIKLAPSCTDLRVTWQLMTNYTVWWRYAVSIVDVCFTGNDCEERKTGDIEGLRATDAAQGELSKEPQQNGHGAQTVATKINGTTHEGKQHQRNGQRRAATSPARARSPAKRGAAK